MYNQNPYYYPNPGQFQQQPYQAQQNGLTGAFVQSISNVGAEMVPMGRPSIFPLLDGSAIYVRQWNNQGMISTVKYVPEVENKQIQPDLSEMSRAMEHLMTRVSNIEKGLGIGGDNNE